MNERKRERKIPIVRGSDIQRGPPKWRTEIVRTERLMDKKKKEEGPSLDNPIKEMKGGQQETTVVFS